MPFLLFGNAVVLDALRDFVLYVYVGTYIYSEEFSPAMAMKLDDCYGI